jgi:thiamine monophosphate kinase
MMDNSDGLAFSLSDLAQVNNVCDERGRGSLSWSSLCGQRDWKRGVRAKDRR